jgi:GH35 family endo-1,4-beta-xylanase
MKFAIAVCGQAPDTDLMHTLRNVLLNPNVMIAYTKLLCSGEMFKRKEPHALVALFFFILVGAGSLLAQTPHAAATGVRDTTGTEDSQRLHSRLDTERLSLLEAKRNIEKYRKGDVSVSITDSAGKPLKNVRLAINQATQDFLFGNLSEEMFSPGLTAEEMKKFQAQFLALFNFTELTIKWAPYEPEQGKPEWQKLKQKLDWCLQNGVTPKGHTLGWTHVAGTPSWLMKLPYRRATDLYKARIHNLVGGFKKHIKMWDVVNEPVTTIPWERALLDTVSTVGQIDEGFRYNVKGISLEETLPWVDSSFRWAGEADPGGDLIINEFYVIAKPEVRERYYQLIRELQKRGVPVRGIGIQAHEPRDMWFPPREVVASFKKFDSLKLPLHITEFIPQSSGKPITGGWRQGLWTEEAQADFAEQFYTLAFGHPSVASIHWWGLSDKMIWLQGGGLLDKNLAPKPVYNRLLQLIKRDWMTKNLRLTTNKKGEASFRGFFGNYHIVVTKADGTSKTFEAPLQDHGLNKWVLSF